MKRKGGRILWLVYIDSTVPRSRGRVLPRHLAVPRPQLQEVREALARLGYRFEEHPDKRYPPLWYEERLRGYFVVASEEPVRAIAAKVAEEVRKARGG